MTGREFVMAAAKVADVYTRATPYIFKLKVILKKSEVFFFCYSIILIYEAIGHILISV